MTEQEAINYLKHNSRKMCQDCYPEIGRGGSESCDFCNEAKAYDVAIQALEKQAKYRYRWHNLVDNPTDTPDKYNCDWVLVQIVEDNGYVWIPKVADYRANKQDWLYGDYWLSDYGELKIVAWCELPPNDWSDSNEER